MYVREAYATGVWVAGSNGRMPGIAAALPDYVECVRIFAHRDNPDDGGAGIRYAQEAARLIAANRINVKFTHLDNSRGEGKRPSRYWERARL